MKIVIAIVCCEDGGDHTLLVNSIRKTWGKTANANVEIWYLWANNRKQKGGRDFVIKMEEGYGSMMIKILDFIEFYKEQDFDYLMKVNTGSYVDVDRLFSFLEDKPRKKFYCGTPGRLIDIHFVSGSGIIFSRDLALLMAKNRNEFGVEHIDDVAIGLFMQNNGVEIYPKAIRLTYHGDGKILQIGEDVIPEPEFDYNKVYHYRLRSKDGERDVDCAHMHRLFKELNP
jgi:hypothetical protein